MFDAEGDGDIDIFVPPAPEAMSMMVASGDDTFASLSTLPQMLSNLGVLEDPTSPAAPLKGEEVLIAVNDPLVPTVIEARLGHLASSGPLDVNRLREAFLQFQLDAHDFGADIGGAASRQQLIDVNLGLSATGEPSANDAWMRKKSATNMAGQLTT